MPQFEKAAERGEEARVLSCLAAGMGGSIDLDDLGCHDNKGLMAKAGAGRTYNDLMIKVCSLSICSNLGPGVLYPSSEHVVHSCLSRLGQVQYLQWSSILYTLAVGHPSNASLNLCSLVLAQPFSSTPEECAEYMVHHLTRPDHKTGDYYLSNNGDDAVKNKYLEQADIREKVWDYGLLVTGLSKK